MPWFGVKGGLHKGSLSCMRLRRRWDPAVNIIWTAALSVIFPDFSPSHFSGWINGVALLMAATIMKSLVNQLHHSSSYLGIASVCLSTAREPSSDCNIVMQILMWNGVNGASRWEIFIETLIKECVWKDVRLHELHNTPAKYKIQNIQSHLLLFISTWLSD